MKKNKTQFFTDFVRKAANHATPVGGHAPAESGSEAKCGALQLVFAGSMPCEKSSVQEYNTSRLKLADGKGAINNSTLLQYDLFYDNQLPPLYGK